MPNIFIIKKKTKLRNFFWKYTTIAQLENCYFECLKNTMCTIFSAIYN